MKLMLLVMAALVLQGCANFAVKHEPTLSSLQGGWWSSCSDPTAEFFIDNDTYYGDFSGVHSLSLSNNTLTFNSGVLNGHGPELSNTPMAFRVISASANALVLQQVDTGTIDKNWILYSCKRDDS